MSAARDLRPGYTGKLHGDAPGESEFSWGAGLVPKDRAGLPPSEGGRYSGLTPREEG